MQLLTPDFYSSIHRTLVDIATLALLVIGLARIIWHDLTNIQRPRRKKRTLSKLRGNERRNR